MEKKSRTEEYLKGCEEEEMEVVRDGKIPFSFITFSNTQLKKKDNKKK